MITLDTEALKGQKNLLAFSSGIDSSALFFLLLEHHISFDIAHVNYGTRKESHEEEENAKILAKQYNLKYHTLQAPTFENHFEAKARTFRYHFFEQLIETHGYKNLLTAHQLGDQLEWFLMRLTKGAGVSELIGLTPLSQRETPNQTVYRLIRPLLRYTKEELHHYLKSHNYPYFVDESNSDEKYERNYFRKHFSDPLLKNYKQGIQKSIAYLTQDKERLEDSFELLYKEKQLRILKLHTSTIKVKAADVTLKALGYLLSTSQRQEIEKQHSLVIGGAWAIEHYNDLLYISPYQTTPMPKTFKEQCRILHIPRKIRPYCFSESINITLFKNL
jgi:tRNA(Ile)-lysidine synthase